MTTRDKVGEKEENGCQISEKICNLNSKTLSGSRQCKEKSKEDSMKKAWKKERNEGNNESGQTRNSRKRAAPHPPFLNPVQEIDDSAS